MGRPPETDRGRTLSARWKPFSGPGASSGGIPIRITRYRANCPKCGSELAIYPRHIEHHEPVVCPSCGRKNSADEFDLRDQVREQRAALRRILGRKD